MALAAAYGIDIRPPIGPLAASGGAVGVEAGAHPTIDASTTGGKDYHSFPGLAIDGAGKLHLVYHSGTDHVAQMDGEIRYRTSTDLGQTWSSATLLVANAGDGFNLTNPSIAVLTGGRMLLTYARFDTAPTSNLLWRRYSDDGGTTWSAAAAMFSPYSSFMGGPGPAFTTSDGVLMKPIYGKNTGANNYSCGLLRSTDNGATWGDYTEVFSNIFGLDPEEPNLFERADKLLGMIIRTDNAGDIYRAWSPDGGRRWSKAEKVFDGVGDPATAVLDSGAIVVVTRKDDATTRPVFTSSLDGGITFAAPADLETTGGPYEYAALARLGVNRLLCVYSVSPDLANQYASATLKSCYLSQA